MMKVIIVGGGPVACLVALGFRKRSFRVELYEKSPDIRRLPTNKGNSFNLTLTQRGMNSLDSRLKESLYEQGVPLPQRVIHHVDGSLSYQPYGTKPEHHLLSIPRHVLHRTLLDKAMEAGAHVFFDHECIGADPGQARAQFTHNSSGVYETIGDLLIGCDGANSIIRHEMSRRGARMQISQEYIPHAFIELTMPPAAGGEHALLLALRNPGMPESHEHGLHVWPRGDFMLLSQPNVDMSYTTSLFMPLTRENEGLPSFRSLRTPDDVTNAFSRHFGDIVRFLPQLSADFFATPPGPLKTVKCFPYHHERTVLIGDSAHTIVPFYGQGINCSFEDVHKFFDILDRNITGLDPHEALSRTLANFTETRKAPGDAIADLSLTNLQELTAHTGDDTYHVRRGLERTLHMHYPDNFLPLYHMVAFTNIPYHDVIRRDKQQCTLLNVLCRRFDMKTESNRIIDSYVLLSTSVNASRPTQVESKNDFSLSAAECESSLDLNPSQAHSLLTAVSSHLRRYHENLAKGQYPASYLNDLTNASDYSAGRSVARRLREDQVPQFGTDIDVLLDQIFDTVITNGMVHPHPGLMSHIPSGGLFQAAVGDFIARALNRFAGVWAATPGFTQIESNVIRWFCTMLGYGDQAFGYLTTGGSIANFMALRCALQQCGDATPHRARVYVSSQGHFSVAKAARMAGLSQDQIRVVGTRRDYSMNLEHLRMQVEQDKHECHSPTCVVATAGTTNTGAIDDLAEIAAYCRDQNIWLHTDACFGGFFRLTDRGKAMLRGIEAADSISIDAHKSLFLPHGTSALLVKEKSQLRNAFEVPGAAYIPELSNEDEHIDFCNYGPELTREVRGLTAWLPIKLHGIKEFERCLDHKLDLADYLAENLHHTDRIEPVRRGSPHLPTVAFKLCSDDSVKEDHLNERLCKLICSRGNVYVATTRLPREGLVVRVCILHHQTGQMIVDQLLDDIQWAIKTIDEDR
jgi:glutamate/tyrosine decarboxylase-like PLP-dependent enzyme/2-polyprenyl-6-methoxyphenol hydroxylase-like FAD-dependent oxidoreductase